MDSRLPEGVRNRLEPVTESGCWIWTGPSLPSGYGTLSVKRKSRYVHRFTYEAIVGPIPNGLEIDHLCRVRCCANPSHLEPVTHKVNTLRGQAPSAINARLTHCPAGHPYDDENTYKDGLKYRHCKICRSEAMQRFRRNNPSYSSEYGKAQRNREGGRRCTVEGCGKPYLAKGLCSAHYQRNAKVSQPSTMANT